MQSGRLIGAAPRGAPKARWNPQPPQTVSPERGVIVVPVFLVWGFAVVADSAQFSALVTETAEDRYRGTALTLQTAIGFLLTLVTIRGVPIIAESVGWRWSFLWLALGPIAGIWAMRTLLVGRRNGEISSAV